MIFYLSKHVKDVLHYKSGALVKQGLAMKNMPSKTAITKLPFVLNDVNLAAIIVRDDKQGEKSGQALFYSLQNVNNMQNKNDDYCLFFYSVMYL